MTAANSVCLITGGSSGVGLATAKRFASQGYRVAVCARNDGRLERAISAIQVSAQSPEHIFGLATDVSIIDNAERFVQQAVDRFGHVDVLVNNAGAAPHARVADFTNLDFESAIRTNIQAVFGTTRAVWPHMMRRASGVVVNISSMAAVDPFPGLGIYGACKAWTDVFTQAIAEEGRELGIRAISLRLGAVETPMLRSLFPDFPESQALSAEEVGEFIVCAISAPMRFASGSVIQFRK